MRVVLLAGGECGLEVSGGEDADVPPGLLVRLQTHELRRLAEAELALLARRLRVTALPPTNIVTLLKF